jgi:hypothetical protein
MPAAGTSTSKSTSFRMNSGRRRIRWRGDRGQHLVCSATVEDRQSGPERRRQIESFAAVGDDVYAPVLRRCCRDASDGQPIGTVIRREGMVAMEHQTGQQPASAPAAARTSGHVSLRTRSPAIRKNSRSRPYHRPHTAR